MSKFLFRMTRCDSGLRLNPLMHLFVFVTFMFALAFVLPGIDGVTQSVLYMQTLASSTYAVSVWGWLGLITVICHLAGFLIRGRVGTALIQVAAFLGFFLWVWAGWIYLLYGFIFQFLVGALPNILFWIWYAWQWRRRYHNKRVAFV